MDLPFANDHQDRRTSCKWSSGQTSLFQMTIWMDQPLANNRPDQPASYKWSSGWTGFLQIIMWMDHQDRPAPCEWLSRWTGLLQMIIQPLTNDHPERLASCKWSFWWISLLQMMDRIEWPLANDHSDGSFSKIILLFLLCSSFPPQTQKSKFKNHKAESSWFTWS